MDKETKLQQAKSLLKQLGLPPRQANDRSGWVLLALANIKPEDDWSQAQAPLLPTVNIMQFIREHYGMDYKPNSRETIRRQTLHQFEQARIVDRNRDDPSRATNSKDNNYSLNQPIIDIMKEFPDGDWQAKIRGIQREHSQPSGALQARATASQDPCEASRWHGNQAFPRCPQPASCRYRS